jgi:hypothetical protein
MMMQRAIERMARILGGDFDAKIFFLHILKCGGTSIFNSIRNCYNVLEKRRGFRRFDHQASLLAARILHPGADPFSATGDYEILKQMERLLLYFMSERSARFVTGHYSFSEQAYQEFHSEYSFLTMLRDPVDRWISLYYYNKHTVAQNFAGILENQTVTMRLSDYIDTDYARSQGFDIVKYIGGASADGDYASPQAIERAKRNLDKFHIVGVLERLDDFASQFKARFGVDLKLRTLNESPVSAGERDAEVTEEVRKRIEEICRPDLEVYRYAVEKFVKEGK